MPNTCPACGQPCSIRQPSPRSPIHLLTCPRGHVWSPDYWQSPSGRLHATPTCPIRAAGRAKPVRIADLAASWREAVCDCAKVIA